MALACWGATLLTQCRREPAAAPGVQAPPARHDQPRDGDRIAAGPGDLRDFNVLIVTSDTTRADHLGCYGYDRVETPVIDRLAREGVLCETAITPSPSTLPAHCSLLTGLYPAHHGVRANGTFRLEEDATTLAERLRARGYATGAVVSAAVLDSRYGLDQGFDAYDDDLTRGRKFSAHMFRERPAELTNEPAIAWLRTHAPQKFFLWVHYFDAHAVYLPPEPFLSRYRDHLYDGELAYVDSQMGALLGELERLGVRDRTLVIYASDHGEGLGEHGELTHSLLIYDSTLHVPLIFNAPSRLPPGSIRSQVSLVDVVPTTLALLGEPVPAGLDGVSLCEPPPAEPRPVSIETIATMTLHGWAPLLGVRRADHKYIFAPTPELYDLKQDPGELNNLHAALPKTVALLGEDLARFVGGDPFLAARGIAPTLAMDEKTRRELAALGYLATVGKGAGAAGNLARDPKDLVRHWEKLQEGLNLRAQGRMREALPILEERVAEVEGDIFARQVLAGCYQMRWEFDKVLEIALRSAELEPNDETIRLSIAAAHLGRGALEEAEKALEEALAIEPQCAQAYVQRGRIALRRGDEQQALSHYQAAIEMDPGSVGPAAYNEIGFVHLRARRLEEAREAYRKAIEIDAFDGDAHSGLADILIEEGKLDEAGRELVVALRFDPNQPHALATLASLMIERGELVAAIQLCERALELSPKLPQAHTRMGLAYRRQNRPDLAEAHYKEAIRHGPFLDAAHVNLAQLQLSQGRDEEAMRQFEQALRANPYCAIALANLGAQHFNEGRVGQAFACYRRALRVRPDYALVHKHMAAIYALRDDPHRTAHHLRRSLELEPDQPEAASMRFFLGEAEKEAAARPAPDAMEPAGQEALAAGAPQPEPGTAHRGTGAEPASPRSSPSGSRRPGALVHAPWNLLLVTLDTTRADHLGCYGYRHARTPVIDAWSAQGVTYERCYTPVPLTLPSHCSIMTGLWPPRHGVHVNGGEALSPDARTLAEVLGERGYAAAAVIGAAVLERRFGLDQGFDHYDDGVSGAEPGPFDFAQRDARQVTDAALEWLAQDRDAPFFLWVHYFDPHAPYEPPGFRKGFETRTGYDAEISFVDSQLGRLIDSIDAAAPARGTLVILTADHGEGLGEHGEPTHGLFAYESTLRVPLVVRFPDQRGAGTRIVQPVGVADVMPSVLAWLSAAPAENLDGRELPLADAGPSGTEEPRALYFENRSPADLYGWSPLTGVIAGDSKLILAPRPELYDLTGDPHESRNLYAESDLRSATMRDRFKAMLADMETRPYLTAAPAELPPEAVARLRSLGYSAGWPGAQQRIPAPDPARADPKDMVQVYWRLQAATTLLSEERWSEAADLLTGIATDDPANKRAILLLADLVNREDAVGRVAEALAAAAAHRFDPATDLYVRGQLGLARVSQGRYADAADAFRAALEIDPGSVPAHVHLARALRQLGAPPEEVLAHLERAVELAPHEWRYALELAGACEAANRAEQAATAYYRLGEALQLSGEPERAREAFGRALELAGDGSPPWLEDARRNVGGSGHGP